MVFDGSDILFKFIEGIDHSLTLHSKNRGEVKFFLKACGLNDSVGHRKEGAFIAQRGIKIAVLKICFVNVGLDEKLPEFHKGDGQVDTTGSFESSDLIFAGNQGAYMDQAHLFSRNFPDHAGRCGYRGHDGRQVGHKSGSVFFDKGNCNRIV